MIEFPARLLVVDLGQLEGGRMRAGKLAHLCWAWHALPRDTRRELAARGLTPESLKADLCRAYWRDRAKADPATAHLRPGSEVQRADRRGRL